MLQNIRVKVIMKMSELTFFKFLFDKEDALLGPVSQNILKNTLKKERKKLYYILINFMKKMHTVLKWLTCIFYGVRVYT